LTLDPTDAAGRAADPLADDDERATLREELRRLIERHAPPQRVAELDEAERFDEVLYTKLVEAGVLAIGGPAEFGGTGDVRHQVVTVEELAAGPTSMAAFAVLQFMAIQVLGTFGRAEQLDLLRGVMTGEAKVSFAMSEPDGGTDVARAMKTRAAPERAGFRIRGHKTWISGATVADHLLVLARTATSERSAVDGITMFLVPADAPGVQTSEIATHGMRGLSTCDVHLDDVLVPESAIVGERGAGFRNVFATLNRERLNAAAACIGVARGAMEVALAYAAQREAFGRPIGAFQALQHRLVDGAISLEGARGLVVRAAAVEAAGGRADVLATMAKVAASEAAMQVTDAGMRQLAGAGFSRALPMQRWIRDGRLWTFSPVSDEMCRNYLGERWLGLPRSY
jgi:acyl-CoA dehydrogenase